MLIKIIVIVFASLMLLNNLNKLRKRQIHVGFFLFWSLLWIGIVVAAWWPGTTDIVALRFGVSRGVDLVVFLSILAIFYGIYRVYVKVDKVERKITQLVRQEALRSTMMEQQEQK